jgi:zinc protease
LREDKGGVYGVGVYPSISKFPKQEYHIYIMFGCAPDRVDELITAVKEQIKDMQDHLPTDSNMVKITETGLREYEVDIKQNRYWLNSLYYALYYNDDPNLILKRPEFIKALKPEEIQNAAKKYLNGRNYMKFVLYPEK